MRLTDELAVSAPADRAWELLLDLPRLAGAVPGASLDPDPVGGSYRGTLGRYAGTATLQDVDEDERVASFYLQGRDSGGQGTAAATIAMRVQERDGGTRVVVDTDLALAGGRPLARGEAQDRATAMLAAVAREVERGAAGGPVDAGAAATAIGERVLLVLAGIAAGFAAGRLFGRRR